MAVKKRYRRIEAKDGELKCQYGKLPYCNPDIVYSWGKNTSKSDARLLHGTIPKLIDELVKRGYDVTTLKFSIKKYKEI